MPRKIDRIHVAISMFGYYCDINFVDSLSSEEDHVDFAVNKQYSPFSHRPMIKSKITSILASVLV